MADAIEHDLSPQSDTFIIYKGPLSPGKFSPFEYREPGDRDPEHIELLKTTRLEYSPRGAVEVQLSNERQTSSSAFSIIILTCAALVPAFFGVSFYVSLGLTSPNGEFYPNQTFARPIDDGLRVDGILLSPLLISSISSTIIGDIGVWATSLLAFHLAYRWLKASRGRPESLPSPYQLFLMCQMVTQASLTSFFNLTKYLLWRNPTPTRNTPPIRRRWAREPMSGLLLTTSSGLAVILVLSLGIRGIDIFLHDGIVSTVIPRNSSIFINGATTVSQDCAQLSLTGCAVKGRSTEASDGGRNASINLAVYEVPYDPVAKSVAYVGPVVSDASISAVGPTVAVATNCSISSVVCEWGEQVNSCRSRDSIWDVTFNTANYAMRLQLVLASDQNLTGDPGEYWSSGTARNPLNVAGFVSFTDLANVSYSVAQGDIDPEHPYLSWWDLIDFGIPDPRTLVFAFDCETSVHDALYTLSDGVVSLQQNTLSLANASTTVAISGPLVWFGNVQLRSDDGGNATNPGSNATTTNEYMYASRYLDEQLQVDITTAGNTYGNDTARFSAAIAQSLSDRLAGWSAGAITMEPMEANRTQYILALRIPLVLSWAYIGLHGIYALVILLLGVSCLVLPSARSASLGSGPYKHKHKRKLSDEDGDVNDPTVSLTGFGSSGASASDLPRSSDLAEAQLKLSDASTLVYELVQRDIADRYPEQQGQGQHIVRLDSYRRSRSQSRLESISSRLDGLGLGLADSVSSSTTAGSDGVRRRRYVSAEEQNSVRIAVRPDVDGVLRLQTL